MAFVIIESADRLGKTTIAELYKAKGYRYIHFTRPDKKYYQPGYTGPSYLDDLVEQLTNLSGENVVFDRSWYGEACIWPQVYGRRSLLTLEDINLLRDFEDQNSPVRILMHDPNTEAHWQRCVEGKEPLSRSQFNSANQMYQILPERYGFTPMTLNEAKEFVSGQSTSSVKQDSVEEHAEVVISSDSKPKVALTQEQLKLQQANAINDVMSGRIVKRKGEAYDLIESKIRSFLNTELGVLLGTANQQQNSNLPFSREEIDLLKAVVQRMKDKR
jgi:hypothetical protein